MIEPRHTPGLCERDGSWREVVVLSASGDTWDRMLGWARGRYPGCGTFTIDGTPAPMPARFLDIRALHARASPEWRLNIGGLTLHCHFHSESRVELDLDPAALGEDGVTSLMAFMRELGALLSHDVYVTPENSWNAPILVYLHEPNRVIAGAAIDREEFEA